MNQKQIVFSRADSAKFFRTLNKRVNQYFKENNVARSGNWKLHLKTAVMFTLYLAPYFLIMLLDMPGWLQLLLVDQVVRVGRVGEHLAEER